ncbi:hypothetical protein Barb7_03141 [Bacteroidales bacterium Barb7]|nr:hypothetical protein Barb7_03141 [Bacteroidales bacterium Barb7]
MAVAELFDGGFMVGKRIVAQVAVAVVVIPFGAARMPAAMSDTDNDKAGLRQAVGARAWRDIAEEGAFLLRAGIDVVDDGIDFG